ncbi:(R)-1-hydroxy-2-aminoethylphosphonate ammonia-lyase [Amorphus coralli]|uniref:(R)-1-hydroxy-2-aminoethylphosphonate ammonia-lyase n=1 Tax=Amorphus coralli TaxID=340680 RepID=UPI000366BD57|nr:aspartate aminotransferase family protein [Amorphus coralli]
MDSVRQDRATRSAEGDLNTSPERQAWSRRHIDRATSDLLARDAAVFLHQSLSTPCLNVVERAEGAWLVDDAGRRILDLHGNAVHQVGYGHPAVVAAITEAMRRLPFSPRRYTNRIAVEFAEALVASAPEGLSKILFAPSGSAAIGMALKLARKVTGRHKTLSMWDAFHGANLDAISVGGEALFRRDAGPLLPGTEHVPPLGLARRFFGEDGHAQDRLADYIDYVLEVQGDVAAVVAEPMRWTTIEPPEPGFWPRVRDACDRHGALLIFDEIPSCLGRTGTLFFCEQVGAVPDMLVLGKGLGGGIMPLAALLARGELDVAGAGAIGHYTHEKSPVACAAGHATLRVIEDGGLVARTARLGNDALERLGDSLGGLEPVVEVRGRGLAIAVEVDSAARAERILYAALDAGVSFKVGGGKGLVLTPPLTITEDDLAFGLEVIEDAVRTA